MAAPPFTALQWEELEQQALIFKYLMAGAPVPPELLLPIRRSFYHHASLGYCSFYGKKLDPEPGRCRRTDGKKWRCAKDAHPDSKYCERHMHRSRSRSRKPVESHSQPPTSQSQSPSSTMTSLAPTGTGSRGITGSFQNVPLQRSVAGGGILEGSCSGSQLNMDLGSYGLSSKEYRYPYGMKNSNAEVDEHSFLSDASRSARYVGMESSLESPWGLMPSRVSCKAREGGSSSSSYRQSSSYYPQLRPDQDLEQATIDSLSRPHQHQQYSFFGCDFGSPEPVKLESHQSLHPFFDEWPKPKDSWSDLEDGRSGNSFSTTQLSISIPMASSDFSTTTTSRSSPNNDDC